jgi:hypothetical protein
MAASIGSSCPLITRFRALWKDSRRTRCSAVLGAQRGSSPVSSSSQAPYSSSPLIAVLGGYLSREASLI